MQADPPKCGAKFIYSLALLASPGQSGNPGFNIHHALPGLMPCIPAGAAASLVYKGSGKVQALSYQKQGYDE